MTAGVMVCALLAAGAAPVPPVPADQTPPPRPVKPDVSLVVLDEVLGRDGTAGRTRLWKLGFRNGRPLPRERVCEGDFLECFGRHELVADRFLVTSGAGVVDLREKKVLSDERDGDVMHVGPARVTYSISSKNREGGVFTCEYSTGKVTRVEKEPARRWYADLSPLIVPSPDATKVVEWRDEDELVLHREFGKPVSLGKGFRGPRNPKVKVDPALHDWTMFPVLWLDDEHFLTQREHGRLVAVDLNGKVAEVVTIKEAPKFETSHPHLWRARDGSGAIIYSMERKHFVIDVAKKTAVKSEWEALGHGFEASWERPDRRGDVLRYNGKTIGQQDGYYTDMAVTTPGYLALPLHEGERDGLFKTRRVAVWSVEGSEWHVVEFESLGVSSVVGWVK
jgi:hypothetical protein